MAKTLTVIVPLYNEEGRIDKTIKSLNQYRPPAGVVIEKFVFVNDGSTDQTLSILKAAKLNFPAEILSYRGNRGRGFAVKMGVRLAKSDYVMYLDGDYSIPLENLKAFAGPMRAGVPLIVGSKKLAETVCLKKRSWLRELIGSGHSLIFGAILGLDVKDFQGGLKVFSREVAETVFPKLRQERWGMDAELLYVASLLGYEILELPVTWSHFSVSSKVALGRDVARALKDVVEIRISGLVGRYGAPEYAGQLIPSLRVIACL